MSGGLGERPRRVGGGQAEATKPITEFKCLQVLDLVGPVPV